VTRRLRLLLVALVVAVAALVMAERPKPPGAPAPATTGASVQPAPFALPSASVDPASIRDVFRFAERPASPVPRFPPRPAAAAAPARAPASDLPKLVGLVRRQGRLLAAFAVEGDVVLAGPGDTAAGVTVLDVSEDGVRVRRKDGSEERLRVP
jgi:hypothetical protein